MAILGDPKALGDQVHRAHGPQLLTQIRPLYALSRHGNQRRPGNMANLLLTKMTRESNFLYNKVS
jgi:hypothetical protein